MSHEENKSPQSAAQQRLEQAETLIWALLDEHLEPAEANRLFTMIEEDAAVRALYIECVQLHVDLKEHFGRKEAEKEPGTAIMASLLPGIPGLENFPQVLDS
jgi:hypothetical protein